MLPPAHLLGLTGQEGEQEEERVRCELVAACVGVGRVCAQLHRGACVGMGRVCARRVLWPACLLVCVVRVHGCCTCARCHACTRVLTGVVRGRGRGWHLSFFFTPGWVCACQFICACMRMCTSVFASIYVVRP